MTRQDGFFIINKKPFTTDEGADKNAFKINALDINMLYAKYDKNDLDNTTKYDLAYWLGEKHIVIDCDSQEQTNNVLNYLNKLNIETYWYYSTKEKGSAHFWFSVNDNVRLLIDKYKLNANTKIGIFKIDTRAYRYSNGKKTQGAIYLRSREKENSIQRPTALQLIENINAILPPCPLGLIMPIDFHCIPIPSEFRNNEKEDGRYKQILIFLSKMIKTNFTYNIAADLGIEIFKYLGYSSKEISLWSDGTYLARWDYAMQNTIKDEEYIPDVADLEDDEIIETIGQRLQYFNGQYFMYDSKYRKWLNISTIGPNLSATYRHISYNFKLSTRQLPRILTLIENEGLNKKINPYNEVPFFKNGYFNEDMTEFIKYGEIIPFNLFTLDIDYEYVSSDKYDKTVMNWLLGMFGDMNTLEDFFMNISPVLCATTASTWIVLYQVDEGNAGKTSIQLMIRDVVSSKFSTKLNTTAFFENETFASRDFINKLYVYSEENFGYLDNNTKEMIKSNINNSHADITVNVKHSNIAMIKNTLSWLSSTNDIPLFSIMDTAFTDRLIFYKCHLKTVDKEDLWIFNGKNNKQVLPTIMNLLVEGFKKWQQLNGDTARNSISKYNSNNEIFKNAWLNDEYAAYFSNKANKKFWSPKDFTAQYHKVNKKVYTTYLNNLKKVDKFTKLYGMPLIKTENDNKDIPYEE